MDPRISQQWPCCTVRILEECMLKNEKFLPQNLKKSNHMILYLYKVVIGPVPSQDWKKSLQYLLALSKKINDSPKNKENWLLILSLPSLFCSYVFLVVLSLTCYSCEWSSTTGTESGDSNCLVPFSATATSASCDYCKVMKDYTLSTKIIESPCHVLAVVLYCIVSFLHKCHNVAYYVPKALCQ